MDVYVNRLFEEWVKHKKIIISIDYDDTIYNWNLNNIKDQEKVISLCKQAYELGILKVIYEDGKFSNLTTFKEVRERLSKL